jgi:hypothetical protein
MSLLPVFFLAAVIVYTVMGRILLVWMDALRFTKLNLFIFVIGAFAGGWLFTLLVLLFLALAGIDQMPAREENRLAFFGWLTGGPLGGTGLAWLKIRLTKKPADEAQRH